MLITLPTPNGEETLVGLRAVLEKSRVGLKGRTLVNTERLFECCDGGEVVDRSAVEGRQSHIRSSGNAQRTSRERRKDVVVAPPRPQLYLPLPLPYIHRVPLGQSSPIPSNLRVVFGLLCPKLHTLGPRMSGRRQEASNASAG